MKLASSTVYTANDCPEALARKVAETAPGTSPAWLAAHEALKAGGWFCLDRKAQKALGYVWQKITVSEPFYHGAWIEETPDGNAVLVVVDHADIKSSPVKGRSC